MPRSARKKSKSGYYHILLRGNNRQNIFTDDQDRSFFLKIMQRYKKELGFEIHAYCLMSNHIHLLLHDPNNQLDLIMKKIAGSYASYFNLKYDRVGHLFQDRFKSQSIEDDTYFLIVLRYIHQNPLKAQIAPDYNYAWSSHHEYMNSPKITETTFALDLLGGKADYISFLQKEDETPCLDIVEKTRITDEEAKKIIKNIAGIESLEQIQKFDRANKSQTLNALKEKGLTSRQIARLTGINRGTVLILCHGDGSADKF